MRGKHGRRQSDVVKVETFNSLKNQLEMENAALLRERMTLQQQSRQQDGSTPISHPFAQIQRSQPDYSPIHAQAGQSHPYQQGHTVQMLRSKIFQIINICQEQGDSPQMHQVAQAERQVLGFLDAVPGARHTHKSHKQIDTPGEKSSKKKKSKLNKTSGIEINKQSHYHLLGDEAMEMIQEIQRKALVQIENLRSDKISLMKKLNAEIKAHNQEKKLRASLQNKVKSLIQRLKRYENDHEVYREERDMEVVDEESEEHNQSPVQSTRNIHKQSHKKAVRSQPKGVSNVQHINTVENSTKRPVQTPLPQAPQRQTHPNPTISPKHSQPRANIQPLPQENTYSQTNINSETQIARQIDRLQQENQRIKLAISSSNPNLKNQLRAELSQLEQKIRFYQQSLVNKQRSAGNIDYKQLENLLHQANHITEEGSKLLKTKKIPEYRTTIGSYESDEKRPRATVNEQNTRRVQERATIDYTRPPLQTFSPMDKSYHSQTYKGGFSPTKYETLIQEMNQATKI